jgi:Potential Monad-binding region of RPAP3
MLLASLVPVLAASTSSPDAVRAYMCALTRVPRFKTVAQFLSRAERGAARVVWDAVVRSTDDTRAEDPEVAEAARVWGFTDA